MAEKKPQTFASHTRFDPLYHFFVLPVFAISVIAAIVHFIWHPGLHSGWLFVVFVVIAGRSKVTTRNFPAAIAGLPDADLAALDQVLSRLTQPAPEAPEGRFTTGTAGTSR